MGHFGVRGCCLAALARAAPAPRQRPVTVLVAQCVVLTIAALIFGSSEMVGVILPLLIGVYSLGAFAPARSQRIIGAASIAAALIAHDLTDPVLDSWQQALRAAAFWILFPVAWLLGDYARTRRLYVAAIRDQAERAQRDREQQTHLEIAQERARIARELHDVVAHGLTVIVRQAEAGEVRLPTDPDGARATFATTDVAARQSLAEMRNLVTLLRVDKPAAEASRQPQLGSFEDLLDGVRRAGVEVSAHQDDLSDLPVGVRLTAYRLVQEALTNTLQHAGATHVDVQVKRRPDSLFTQVVDNGTAGATPSVGGHGLIGLRERIAVYGHRPRRADLRLLGHRQHPLEQPAFRMIRALVVDDQELVRDGIRTVLDVEDDITVVGEAGDGAHAVRLFGYGPVTRWGGCCCGSVCARSAAHFLGCTGFGRTWCRIPGCRPVSSRCRWPHGCGCLRQS